jgi:toxin-antitoxin system PIN domain toxin
VKVPDANVFLYAIDRSAARHEAGRRWVEGTLSGTETVGLTWAVLLAFIRLSTSAAVFRSPLESGEALDLVEGWLGQPNTVVIHPTDRHASVLRELLEAAGTAGNLASDAHLAALAIEHAATLSSFDADFHRFSGLKLEHLH